MSDSRRNLFAFGAIIASVSLLTVQPSAQTTALRVGLVSAAESGAAASIDRGVRLGVLEANQTANLFGGNVVLFESPAGARPEAAAENLLSRRKVQVLIGSSAKDADVLSRFAETHQIIFLNVVSRSLTVRSACRRYTFHIEASDSMYASASARGAASRAPTALLWAPTLERYGASQINSRFRTRYRLPMDGDAWAGWVAVKIASEAALRARSTNPRLILSYLENPLTSFDGHKGWPLSFRSEDHQLRQPLYVVADASSTGSASLRDVPPLSALSRASSGESDANKVLDVLLPKSGARCRWTR